MFAPCFSVGCDRLCDFSIFPENNMQAVRSCVIAVFLTALVGCLSSLAAVQTAPSQVENPQIDKIDPPG